MSKQAEEKHMKPKKKQARKGKQWLRSIINLALIVIGLVAVVSFMAYMQRQYSVMKADQTSNAALDAVVETLDGNTQKVEALRDRYHADNQAILNDMAYLLRNDRYEALQTTTDEERTATMQRLSRTVGENGYLFVIRRDGTVVMAPQADALDANLVANGTLDEASLAILVRDEWVGNVHLEGTDRITVAADGTEESSYDVVTGTPAGTQVKTYFYSMPVTDTYFLVYAVDEEELERQFAALRDVGPVLSSVVVGDNGFVFAVDSQNATFLHFDNGEQRLDGQPIAESGLSTDVLADRYSGLQTIGGVSYHCLSRAYSSPFYGDYIVITAVCEADSVFSGDRTAIGLSAITFILGAAVMIFYTSLLRVDPEQLAAYDEEILDRKTARRVLRRARQKGIHHIRLFKVQGEQIYLKAGIAEKLAPVAAIAVLLVFVISWNSQTLVEITRGIEQSTTAIHQIETLFDNRTGSSEIIMTRYQNQYLSKLELVSFLLEEDSSLLALLNDGTEADGVHAYLDDELNPVYTSDGKPVRAVANAPQLVTLAKNNGFDYLAVYDDQGRTMAANKDTWYFTLSRDRDTQSYPFLDVITGKTDRLIQAELVDERGQEMQYLGAVFHYYVLNGDGPDAGRFVSVEAYETFLADGAYMFNGHGYSVSRHRSLIQGGIADETIDAIMESLSDSALMHQIKVGSDGFTVLFDNSSEHVCLWSPNEASIGRTAAELSISDAAFSGTFKGFTKLNGVECFQAYSFDNGYWIATAIPCDTLFAGRNPIALITTLVALAFYLLLFLLCVFSTESEERAMEKLLEKRLDASADNGLVRMMMPSGKVKLVRSASARYTSASVAWADMNTSQRLSLVLKVVMSIIVVCVILSGIFCDQIFGENSAISYIVHGDWEHGVNYFAVIAFLAVVLSVSVAALISSLFINFIIRNMGSRVETVGRLLLSVVKYGSVLFAIFYGLSLLGFSTAGLVTSASIMSIVIGLGSQSLISDILSGIFIVFEGAFRVGDIVTVGDFRGSVVDIGLRTTKIENMTGDIKIFNNSNIAGIINMTKKASKALCDISIDYGADLQQVEKILLEALPKIGDKNPSIIGHPDYLGVVELGDSAVVLRVDAECAEKERVPVSRYLNRELLILFQQNGINIPFPQVTVSYLDENQTE